MFCNKLQKGCIHFNFKNNEDDNIGVNAENDKMNEKCKEGDEINKEGEEEDEELEGDLNREMTHEEKQVRFYSHNL